MDQQDKDPVTTIAPRSVYYVAPTPFEHKSGPGLTTCTSMNRSKQLLSSDSRLVRVDKSPLSVVAKASANGTTFLEDDYVFFKEDVDTAG